MDQVLVGIYRSKISENISASNIAMSEYTCLITIKYHEGYREVSMMVERAFRLTIFSLLSYHTAFVRR